MSRWVVLVAILALPFVALEAFLAGLDASRRGDLTDDELDMLDHGEGWCSCRSQGLPFGVHRLRAELRGD